MPDQIRQIPLSRRVSKGREKAESEQIPCTKTPCTDFGCSCSAENSLGSLASDLHLPVAMTNPSIYNNILKKPPGRYGSFSMQRIMQHRIWHCLHRALQQGDACEICEAEQGCRP